MKTFEELLINRRSVRQYRQQDVPDELIRSLIRDSTMAPSTGNEQPWRFVVIRDRDLLKEISDDCKKYLLQRIADNPDDYGRKYRDMLAKNEYNIFYNAPLLICIVGDGRERNTVINCTLAAGYLMFSAAARGLGSCWIGFGRYLQDPLLRRKLGIRPEHEIVAPIAVGFPQVIPQPPVRKQAEILCAIGTDSL